MLPPRLVTQKIIDADGDLNDISNEDLAEAGIDSACNVSNNAHEHHEWPVYPILKHEGVDMKALREMEVLLFCSKKGHGQMALAQMSARMCYVWLQSAILRRQMPARTVL